MALFVEGNSRKFNTELIGIGDIIRYKAKTWDKAKNGIVTYVEDDFMLIAHQTDHFRAINYLRITIDDIESGVWEKIEHSKDLMEISVYGDTSAEVTE